MFMPARSRVRVRATFRLVSGLLFVFAPTQAVLAASFAVNSAADDVDASPGDGVCMTAPGNMACTLRGALMEANALPGADTINLQSATYTLTRIGQDATGLNGDLDVLDSVTMVGGGPGSTIIDGNGAATGDRVLQILGCMGNLPPTGTCAAGTGIVVNVSGVTFRHGVHLTESGGGIFNAGALTLSNCSVADNAIANGSGAGIATIGPLTMVNSTVRENVITGAAGSAVGGGLVGTSTTVTITGSTISGNRALLGGGLFVDNSTTSLINTTISGNLSLGNGGGIFAVGGTVGMYNVTIAANQANSDDTGIGVGGGVSGISGASVTLSNSIITSNSHRNEGSLFDTLDDCSGTITSTGNNLVTSVIGAQCTIFGASLSTTASLESLQYNGGLTRTHALPSGSAAVNAGNPLGCAGNFGATLTTDQRGEPRPFGPACDLGAFELGDFVFRDGFES